MSKKLPVLTALALALIGSTGVYAYQKPISYVSLDINPSIELGVNVFDVVVSAEAYNDDGEKVLEDLEVTGGSVEDAINEIVDSAIEEGYVEQDGTSVISITSETEDGELAEELKEAAEEGVEIALEENETEAEIEKDNVALERRDQARELGITPGKLNLIQKLQAVNPEATIEDFKGASVKEIMAATHLAKGIGPKEKDKDIEAEDQDDENEANVQPDAVEPIVEESDNIVETAVEPMEIVESKEIELADDKDENPVKETKTPKEKNEKAAPENKSNKGKSKGN